MKNYILLFIGLALMSSCTLKEETVTTSFNEKKALITKHQWKGLEKSEYVNNELKGKTSIKNSVYTFNKKNKFTLKKEEQIINEGNWEILNISNQAVLKLTFKNSDEEQSDEYFEISVLNDNYLQLNDIYSDGNNNTIEDDYFFSK